MKVVISLGGSVIIPEEVDYKYLEKFSKVIKKFSKRNKIVIVTGGGSTARKYIDPLVKLKKGEKAYSAVGISSTRINARLVRRIFGFSGRFPIEIKHVKNDLKKNNLVICGALGERSGITSDANAAEVAKEIDADFFVNITNVIGLYTKHPKLKNSKLIKEISYDKFLVMANKIKYKAGQHFVLDQVAAKLIKKYKIKTFILSKSYLRFPEFVL